MRLEDYFTWKYWLFEVIPIQIPCQIPQFCYCLFHSEGSITCTKPSEIQKAKIISIEQTWNRPQPDKWHAQGSHVGSGRMDLNPVPLTLDPNACLIACHSRTSTLSHLTTSLGWHPLHFSFVLPKDEILLPSLDHLHWAKLYHGRTFVGNPVGVFINPSQDTGFLNQALGGMHRGERTRDFLPGVSDQPNPPMH